MHIMGKLKEVPLIQELFLRHNFRWSYDQKKHIKTDFIIDNHDWLNILVGKKYFRENQIDYFGDNHDFNEDIFLWLQGGGGYERETLEVFGELILLLEKCEEKEFYELAGNINYIIHMIGNAMKEVKKVEETFADYRLCIELSLLKRNDFEDFDLNDLPF